MPIVQLHGGVEEPLAARRTEVVGGGREHQAADRVGVLAPEPLRDDRAHREAGHDRLHEAELVDHGGGVVGAVGDQEALRGDPAAVPALVEGDHPVALVERRQRREPGQQAGAADGVQEYDGGRVGRRAGQVGEPGPAAAGELQPAALGDLDLGKREAVVQQRCR